MFVVQGISGPLAAHYKKLIRNGTHPSGRKLTETEIVRMQNALDERKVPTRYQRRQAAQGAAIGELQAQQEVQNTTNATTDARLVKLEKAILKKIPTDDAKAEAKAKAKARAKAMKDVLAARLKYELATEMLKDLETETL